MTDTSTQEASFHVAPPENFSFYTPTEWPKWKRRFERFRIASGLTKKTEEEQVNALIYFMGDTADDILLSFSMTDANKKKYDKVMAGFEAHFIVRRNVIFERARFNSRVQEDGEPVDDFITSLYGLSEHCSYSTLKDELIRDRIVVGVRDRHLAEKMQLDDSLTLEKAVKMARQHEAVKKQQTNLRGDSKTSSLNRLEKKFTPKKEYEKKPSSQQQEIQKCKFCNRSHQRKKELCPAWQKKCSKCSEMNHFAVACRKKNEAGGSVSRVSCSPPRGRGFIGALCVVGHVATGKKSGERWSTVIKTNGTDVEYKLDPGADVTAVPLSTYRKCFKKKELLQSTRRLGGPDGRNLAVVGCFDAELCHGKFKIKEEVFVVRGLERPLLGLRACEDLQLVKLQVDALCSEVRSRPAQKLRVRIGPGQTAVHPQEEFPELFDGLGKIDGPHTIKLRSDAKPFAIHSPRRIALPLMEKVKQKLEEFQRDGVIEPVDEPTEWCAPLVIAPKPNNDIRVCVDLTKLNASVERELHPMPVVEHTLGQIAGAKIFSKLDANSGFFQIALAKESQNLTTFLTPFGRFRYLRLPFGITSAPEVFQKRMNEILKGLPCVVHLDDILVWGKDQEEHDLRLREVLARLKTAGVTLNPNKCQFSVTGIKFLGHRVDQNGIYPDEDKVKAIAELPKPTDVSGVRRILGMVNYLGKFVPHLSQVCQPLNEMLKSDREFLWGPTQEEAMKKIRRILTEEPVLALFDVKKKTVVSADASSYGLGAVLLQIQDDGAIRPVSYASRTLSSAERRYAQIEKEALASTWACERFRDFVMGACFVIETDHKPLLQVLVTKDLDELTPRLQRLRMRLMRYDYRMTYVPGKMLVAADTLSRQPLEEVGDPELEEEVRDHVCHILSQLPVRDEYLAKIWRSQVDDDTLLSVAKFTREGWPEKNNLSEEQKTFFTVKDELSVSDGLLLRGSRIVIPKIMREELLGKIHEGHQGVVKCRARAREAIWWPGISEEIAEVVRKCPVCVKERGERKEPLIPSEFPTRPWKKVAMDLFKTRGRWFLLITDYYSRYPEVFELEALTAERVIDRCKAVFSRHGVPEEVMSDNGGQFHPAETSEFRRFAREYGFIHTTSSPRFPQSNGFVEAGVKTVKSLMKKNCDWYKALLEYRATPLANGFSPAELLMGRRIRSTLPMDPRRLVPEKVDESVLQSREDGRRRRQKKDFDRRHGVHEKMELTPGEVVWVKDLRTWGIVKDKASTPRSFIVETPRGSFRRNSHHLTKTFSDEIPEVDPAYAVETTPLLEHQGRSPAVEKTNTPVKTRSGRTVRRPKRLIEET